MKVIEIRLRSNNELIAKGKKGWEITPFEGNYYIQKKLIKSGEFKINYFTGICVYKFLYFWMNYYTSSGEKIPSMGWMYVLANPLFPFIWFRIGLPRNHPSLLIQEIDMD